VRSTQVVGGPRPSAAVVEQVHVGPAAPADAAQHIVARGEVTLIMSSVATGSAAFTTTPSGPCRYTAVTWLASIPASERIQRQDFLGERRRQAEISVLQPKRLPGWS